MVYRHDTNLGDVGYEEYQHLKMEKMRRKLYVSTLLSAIGYHVPISVSYLAKVLGYAPHYSYETVGLLHLLVLLTNLVYLVVIYFNRDVTRQFADRIFMVELIVWLCVYSVWLITLGELRFYGMISAFIVFTFVFSRGGTQRTILIVCVYTGIHLLVCYFAIHYLKQKGDFIYESFLTYHFFLVYLFLAWVGLRIFRQKNALLTSKKDLEQTQIELKQAMDILKKAALTDPLTGLFNRRAMIDAMDSHVGTHAQEKSHVIAICDLDRFKAINDQFGHEAGDRVLVKASGIMKNALRSQDHIARWGGEEFLILIVGVSLEEGERMCNALRICISGMDLTYNNETIKVTGSFGVSKLVSSKAVNQQIHTADECLYLAKKAGRNCVIAHH